MYEDLMQLLIDWEVWEQEWIECQETWPLWAPYPIFTTHHFARYLQLTKKRMLLKEKIKNHIAVGENWLD
jgi:hypothetical protein